MGALLRCRQRKMLKGTDDARWIPTGFVDAAEMRIKQDMGPRVDITLDTTARTYLKFGHERPDMGFLPGPDPLAATDGARICLRPSCDPALLPPRHACIPRDSYNACEAAVIPGRGSVAPLNDIRRPHIRGERGATRYSRELDFA